MAVSKNSMREFKIDINTGTVASPVWTRIKAVSNLDFNSAAGTQDVSDFDGDGFNEQMVTGVGHSCTVEGWTLIDKTDGSFDPGQAALITLSHAMGSEREAQFRIPLAGGTAALVFTAILTNSKSFGGNTSSASTYSYALSVQGDYDVVAIP